MAEEQRDFDSFTLSSPSVSLPRGKTPLCEVSHWKFYSQAQTQAPTISTQAQPVIRIQAQPLVNQAQIQAQAQAQPLHLEQAQPPQLQASVPV